MKCSQKQPLTAEMYDKFMDLSCQLSPENLTCDGELTSQEVLKRASKISKQWKALESEVGRFVSEDEIWNAENAY